MPVQYSNIVLNLNRRNSRYIMRGHTGTTLRLVYAYPIRHHPTLRLRSADTAPYLPAASDYGRYFRAAA